MSLNPIDKLAIIFTITFVDFMIIIVFLLSSEIPINDRLPIVGICGGFLAYLTWSAYRKKPSIKQIKISNSKYLAIFFGGVFLGLFNTIGTDFAYSIDYQNAEPNSFYIGIPLAVGGFGVFLFFTVMSMVILVTQMPFVRNRIKGESGWVPFVAGIVIGFGIMTFYEIISNGLRPLW